MRQWVFVGGSTSITQRFFLFAPGLLSAHPNMSVFILQQLLENLAERLPRASVSSILVLGTRASERGIFMTVPVVCFLKGTRIWTPGRERSRKPPDQ
jgi:hypothetical protein